MAIMRATYVLVLLYGVGAFAPSFAKPAISSSLTRPGSPKKIAEIANRQTLSSSSSSTMSDTSPDDSSESIGVAGATFSLIKAMVGSGMLALPFGLAAASSHKSALIPANIALSVLGILSAYTYSVYGRLTHQTGAKSLGEIWKAIYKTDDSFVVSLSNFVYGFGCCLTFLLIIGDALSSLLAGSGVTGILAQRQTLILGVVGTILLPLCNLRSLASLAPVSVIGVLGTIFTTLFLGFRCPAIVPTSPYAEAGKGLLAALPSDMQPVFGTYNRIRSPAPLVLMAMGCVALMGHFSAPDFYHSLAGSKRDESALKKYNKMTVIGYLAVAIINCLAMSFGFATFGANSKGVILSNFAPSDVGAAISRFLVAVSVIGSFPFIFGACRSGAMELFDKGSETTRSREKKYTFVLLGLATLISLVVEDAGFVVGFNGALMGTALIYIFPSLLFLKQTANNVRTKGLRMERLFNRFLLGFGSVSAILGAATTILNSYFPHLLQ